MIILVNIVLKPEQVRQVKLPLVIEVEKWALLQGAPFLWVGACGQALLESRGWQPQGARCINFSFVGQDES